MEQLRFIQIISKCILHSNEMLIKNISNPQEIVFKQIKKQREKLRLHRMIEQHSQEIIDAGNRLEEAILKHNPSVTPQEINLSLSCTHFPTCEKQDINDELINIIGLSPLLVRKRRGTKETAYLILSSKIFLTNLISIQTRCLLIHDTNDRLLLALGRPFRVPVSWPPAKDQENTWLHKVIKYRSQHIAAVGNSLKDQILKHTSNIKSAERIS